MPQDQQLLEIRDLHGGYDSVTVLHGINLSVAAGSVTALLGRNGMGKSSTIKAVMGLLPSSAGRITLDGQDLGPLAPHQRARLGIGLVPETRQVFPSLTVREHLEMAARPGPTGARSWDTNRLMDLFPVLRTRSAAMGNRLSGGEQQLLVIARALSTNPRLLLLDEPTEGLAPSVVGEIAELLGRLLQEDDAPAVLLVEQNLRFALDVADHAVVLVTGEVAHTGPAAELAGDTARQQQLIGLGIG